MIGPRRLRLATPRAVVWLGGLLIVATGLRLVGLSYGLPAVYNPDEVAIMSRALAFAKGDFNPHNFLYPTFYFYVLFAWVGASYVWGRVAGVFDSLAAFETSFFVDPTYVYLAGRLFSVVCGVAAVVVTYRLASSLRGRTAGLAAAMYLACAPIAVMDAHYVKHDVPATLAVVVAVAAIVAFQRRGSETNLRQGPTTKALVAGAACGVAFSTHYYTVFLTLPLGLAVAGVRGWPRRLTVGVVAAAAAAFVFFALSPFILADLSTTIGDMVANREIVVDRAAAGGGWTEGLRTYGRMLVTEAIGWPVVVLAALGAVGGFRRRPAVTMLLTAFPATFFLFIAHTVPATRYLNPILPFVAILAGWAIADLAESRRRSFARMAVPVALLAALPGGIDAARIGPFFRQPDTRTQAKRFVEQHVPAGSSVVLQPYSVPLQQSRESLAEALRVHLGDERLATVKFARRLALDPYPAPAYRTLFLGSGGLDADKIYIPYADLGGARGLSVLREQGVTIAIVKRYNVPAPETMPFLRSLEAEGRLLAVFSPVASGWNTAASRTVEPFLHNQDSRIVPALERPGPVVEVWQVRDGGL